MNQPVNGCLLKRSLLQLTVSIEPITVLFHKLACAAIGFCNLVFHSVLTRLLPQHHRRGQILRRHWR